MSERYQMQQENKVVDLQCRKLEPGFEVGDSRDSVDYCDGD